MTAPAPAQPPLLSYAGPPGVPTTWTNVRAYRLRPAMRLRVSLRLCAIAALLNSLLVTVGLGLAALIVGATLFKWTWMFAIYLPAFVLYSVLATWFRLKGQWGTFALTLADQGVMRIARKLPPLVLTWDEIAVMDDFGFEFALRGTPRERAIAVSEALEDYPAVRDFIAAHLAPGVRRAGKSKTRLALHLARVIGLALIPWVCVYAGYIFPQLWVAALALLLCIAATTWLMIKTFRSSNQTQARKILALSLCWLAPAYLLARIAYLILVHP